MIHLVIICQIQHGNYYYAQVIFLQNEFLILLSFIQTTWSYLEVLLFKIKKKGYHESQMRYCSCNSLNILNLRTLKWIQGETTGQPPCERQCHSAIVHQGDMYVFGGYAGNSDVVLNDMVSVKKNLKKVQTQS
jgi:hypothetical protein